MNDDKRRELEGLEISLGYRFRDIALLSQALTHRSYVNENPEENLSDNERLEFLGDAVLNLVISHNAMERNPDFQEGELSKLRSAMVNETSLALKAREFSIGSCLLLGRGEDSTNGREKNSILSDTYEAVIASIYLDGGLDEAFLVIGKHFSDQIENIDKDILHQDCKTRLQEMVQGLYRSTPDYVLANAWGPDHDKTFNVRLLINSEVYGEGEGKSKKEAEQEAARKAVDRLERELEAKSEISDHR